MFDEEAIRAGMPEMRVKRGDVYFENGWVDLVASGDDGTIAHVSGETGNVYVVRMRDPRGADAQCACPDFSESRLPCKHVVATARAANALDAAARRELAQRLPRLADLLAAEGRDEGLADAAKDDPALLRELEGR